jgi:hypothetical protein
MAKGASYGLKKQLIQDIQEDRQNVLHKRRLQGLYLPMQLKGGPSKG